MIQISQKFVPRGGIDHKSTLVRLVIEQAARHYLNQWCYVQYDRSEQLNSEVKKQQQIFVKQLWCEETFHELLLELVSATTCNKSSFLSEWFKQWNLFIYIYIFFVT